MLPAGHISGDGVGNQDTLSFVNGKHLTPRPSLAGSRTLTGAFSPSPASTQGSPRGSSETTRIKDANAAVDPATRPDENDPRETILKSFLPKVAVYASVDTQELVRLKGIYGGLCGLLRPFGETIPGSVVVRDSVGASKSWNNFGVHFVDFGGDDGILPWPQRFQGSDGRGQRETMVRDSSQFLPPSSGTPATLYRPGVDAVVERYLNVEDGLRSTANSPRNSASTPAKSGLHTPLYYILYLRKLLSQRPMVPYETFTHPVACVIAISSQCTRPIETLRELYSDTRQGANKVPIWAGNEFLRYYVLVHDEDHDDIAKSMALFDQMKRHFGLHCHLLRLRSIECTKHEEDCMQLPDCQWLSAEEDLQNARQVQDSGADDFKQYLFDTDAAVLKTFVREMVTQSILPFMEGRVTTWNDQVASRRRGISGRFMSLSKKWTGFGSARGAKSSPSSTPGASGSSFDSVQGYYLPDSPEATMLRLADFAFMLRDWRLASSIYDIVRSDFGDDKAWDHHAAANEMATISMLLISQPAGTKPRTDIIDAALDAASYSYITRCSNPQSAARCLLLAVELYRHRGGPALGDATRWGERLLEISILSPLANTLLIERLAICYALQQGIGLLNWSYRQRKAAYCNFLAARAWLRLDRTANASARLRDAAMLYKIANESNILPSFANMQEYWAEVEHEIASQKQDPGFPAVDNRRSGAEVFDEEIEDFDTLIAFDRSNGMSPERRQSEEGIDLLQRLNDPLDQGDDGFV